VSEGPGRVPQTPAIRWTYRIVLLGGLALLWRLNAPGHMSVDSVLALHEGRFHARETWNPAIFGWLLGQADAIVPGQALAMGVGAVILFAAWALMANLRPRASWLGVVLALLVVALPQVMIYPAIVWKDVWFAEAAIAGFVLLAFGLKSPVPAARWGLMGLTALLFALAGLLRQNGLILSAAAAVAIAWGWSASSGWRSSVFSALIWLGAVAVATLALSTYAQPQGADSPDDAGLRGLRIVQTYDLVGAAAHAPLPLSRIDAFDHTLDDKIRAEAKKVWTPRRVDVLDDSALAEAMRPVPARVIRQEWLDLIAQHPGLYLKIRLADFRQVFATPVIDACLPVHLGVSGPAKEMADLKLPQRWTDDDTRLYNYVTWFLDTPAYSHITYAIVALLVGLVLLWRRDPADLAIAGLIGGALAFAASFFVISIACDYRYLYLVDLAAITGALYLAIDPDLSRPRARRRARD
jgi:hypothetical protein